jgi:hypothetical protein
MCVFVCVCVCAGAGDPVAMGMAEPLGKILVQLSGGGGATKLNIDAGV